MIFYNFIPITVIDNERVLVLKRGRLYIFNSLSLMYEKEIISFRMPLLLRILYRSKLLVRILRLNRIINVSSEQGIIFFIYGRILHKLNLYEGSCINFSKINASRKTLKTIYIRNNRAFADGIYYGEYFSNPTKLSCSIYHIDESGISNAVYTFKDGSINHIHSLLEDKFNQCIWIFTGDDGDAAGIWKATHEFQYVEPILRGKQKYRACVGYYDDRLSQLVYATDTPFEQNTLRSLSCKDGQWVSSVLHKISGSVIYGFETQKFLFFSSTVEPNSVFKNKFELLTSVKKGDGIKDYFTYLYQFNKETQELKILFKQKKDRLPFCLFQFGTMTFPSGTWDNDTVPVLCVATKENNLQTVFIKTTE